MQIIPICISMTIFDKLRKSKPQVKHPTEAVPQVIENAV